MPLETLFVSVKFPFTLLFVCACSPKERRVKNREMSTAQPRE